MQAYVWELLSVTGERRVGECWDVRLRSREESRSRRAVSAKVGIQSENCGEPLKEFRLRRAVNAGRILPEAP